MMWGTGQQALTFMDGFGFTCCLVSSKSQGPLQPHLCNVSYAASEREVLVVIGVTVADSNESR